MKLQRLAEDTHLSISSSMLGIFVFCSAIRFFTEAFCSTIVSSEFEHQQRHSIRTGFCMIVRSISNAECYDSNTQVTIFVYLAFVIRDPRSVPTIMG